MHFLYLSTAATLGLLAWFISFVPAAAAAAIFRLFDVTFRVEACIITQQSTRSAFEIKRHLKRSSIFSHAIFNPHPRHRDNSSFTIIEFSF